MKFLPPLCLLLLLSAEQATAAVTYQGCFKDVRAAKGEPINGREYRSRAFPRVKIDSGMGVAKCAGTATAAGYSLFGVQWQSECWFGRAVDDALLPTRYGVTNGCNRTCTVGPASAGMCGGNYAFSLYAIDPIPPKLSLVLSWERPMDIDLYVKTPTGKLLNWDNNGALDSTATDGGLLEDDIYEGPETATWPSFGASPPSGTYHVCGAISYSGADLLEKPNLLTLTVTESIAGLPRGGLTVLSSASGELPTLADCRPGDASFIASFTVA